MVSVSHGSWCPPGGKTAEFGELKNEKYFIFIVFFVMLNMFIAIVLENFESSIQDFKYCTSGNHLGRGGGNQMLGT